MMTAGAIRSTEVSEAAAPDASVAPPPGRLRVIRQMERADCGAACLTMVLAQHGKHLPLARVRAILDGGRDGVTALDIVRAGAHFGLRGGGFAVPVDQLGHLPAGAILHWESAHFVVLARALDDGAVILDPARGRRRLRGDELRRCYSGVALVLEPAEDFVREGEPGDHGALRPLLRLAWDAGAWGRIALASLALQAVGLGLPVVTGLLVDRVVPAVDHSLWSLLCWGALALVLVHLALSLVRGRLLLDLRERLDAALARRLMAQIGQLPYGFFLRRGAGDLMMRVQSNLAIRQLLSAAALSTVMDATLVLTYTALLAAVAPGMAGLVLLLGALQVAVFALTRGRRRELLSQVQGAQAAKAEFEAHFLANMETVKSAGAEARVEARWDALFCEALRVERLRGGVDAICEALAASLRMAAPLVVIAYGVDRVLAGAMSLGEMLSLDALAVAALSPLAGLVAATSGLAVVGAYYERIEDVLQAEPEQDAARVRPAPALTGAIALERVSFRFSPLRDDVVEDVSLTIPAGAFVAIVGPSGAGKSTLARLLSGLHVPAAGRVLVDGHDLANLDKASVRRQIGVVPQRPELLGANILEALRFAAPEATEVEVEAAARRAAIHDEIAALPMGYRTGLSSGGLTFSGGQAQRMALARALVASPRLLILDEATSALDAATEAHVQRALESLECTRIVLAHRLSTIRRADTIVVMDAGRIVETGTHEALLARGGAYARLMASQLAGAGEEVDHAAA